MTMVRSERWKYLAYDGFRPQLFDLLNDPQELQDLGADPAYAAVREEHAGYLFEWVRGLKRRTTISHQEIDLRGQRFRYGEPETEKWYRSACGDQKHREQARSHRICVRRKPVERACSR